MKKIFLLGILTVVLFLGGYFFLKKNSGFSGGEKDYKNTTVIRVNENGFEPNDIKVKVNEAVVFLNTGSRGHWPASDPHPEHDYFSELDYKKVLNPGEEWKFVFGKVGVFNVHDHLFPHFKARVTVVDPSESVVPNSVVENLMKETDAKKQALMVREMAKIYGPKEALKAMRGSGLPFTGDTHLLVHEIGLVAFEKYGDKALLFCDESFLSACYHGVIIMSLAKNGMAGVTAMIDQCKEAKSYVLPQCVHAAGHGFLAYKDYNVLEALPMCDELKKLDPDIPEFNCHDGLFMENIFGVHDGKPSPNKMVRVGDPFYPCNAVLEKYQMGCWANQATLNYQQFNGDLKKVAEVCDKLAEPLIGSCYDNFARQIHPMTKGKSELADDFCKNATGDDRKNSCLIALVGAGFSVGDRSGFPFEVCEYINKSSSDYGRCNETLVNNISVFGEDANEKENMCFLIKNDIWRNNCAKRFENE